MAKVTQSLPVSATPLTDPQAQTDILRAYLMERRRALLTELASIDRLLGLERKEHKPNNRYRQA